MCILLLSGCTPRMFTPVLDTDFSKNAVYEIGDFSYKCKITKLENCLSVEVLSTRAKGLIITYDGEKVTFKRNKMVKSFPAKDIDATNPVLILYSVFESLENDENIEVKRVEEHYEYVGKTKIGEFMLIQNDDNSIASIVVPSADVVVKFDKE